MNKEGKYYLIKAHLAPVSGFAVSYTGHVGRFIVVCVECEECKG